MSSPIDSYLAKLPAAQRKALAQLRRRLMALLPDAEDAIKTRVPALQLKGKTVVGFGAAKQHLALYVMFGDALRALRDELSGYDASARVIRFLPERPLPEALLRKIVRFRLAEIAAAERPR